MAALTGQKAQEVKKAEKKKVERVSLKNESLERLEKWVTQTKESFSGITISRADLVNWLVVRHGDSLSARELSEIKNEFFDEEKFVAWALEQIRDSKKRGVPLGLKDLVNEPAKKRVRPKKPKDSSNTLGVTSVV